MRLGTGVAGLPLRARKSVAFSTIVRRALVPYIASLRDGTQSQGSGGIRQGSQEGSGAEEPLARGACVPQRDLPHVSLTSRAGTAPAVAHRAAGGGRRARRP